MRLLRSMICAGCLFASAPALAQGNQAAPSNAPQVNAVAPANNGAQNQTAMTASVAPTVENEATTPAKTHSGFPWGVLGLVGLIGLFGVRKAKT